MAEVHNIDVVVKATDHASNVLDRLVSKFGITTSQGLAMGATFAVVTKSMDYLMQGFQKAVDYIKEGIEANRQYELSLTKLQMSLVDFDTPIKQVEQLLRGFSIYFATDLGIITEGLRTFIREGYNVSDSLQFLNRTLMLYNTTNDNFEDVQRAVISTMEVFDYDASNMGYVIQKINEVIGTTGMSISDFDRILSRSTDAIRNNVIGFDDLVNILYTLDQQGYGTLGMIRKIQEILENPTQFKIEVLPENLVPDVKSKFDAISGTTKFTADRILQLNKIKQMMISEPFDFTATIDEYKWNQALDIFDQLKKKGIETWDDLQKAGDITVATDWAFDMATGTSVVTSKVKDLNSATLDLIKTFVYNNQIADETFGETAAGKISRLEGILDKLQNQLSNYNTALKNSQENFNKLTSQRTEMTTLHPLQNDLRYISMGLQDATYSSKIFNDATRELVDSIREQHEEIDSLNRVNQIYNMEQNKNTLEIMRIEYDAMGHRGRMTRDQKQTIEELERANMGLRISTAENQLQIDQATMNLDPLEKRLDQTKLWYDEEIFIIQDTYNKELTALNDKITAEQKLLNDNYEKIKDINAKILQNDIDTYNARSSLYGVSPQVSGFNLPSWVPKLQTGIDYVPHTGPYILHQGEKVVSKNQNKTSGIINLKVDIAPWTINVTDNTDIQTLTRRIELAIQSGLINGVTTTYG
jgi:hypothetical protein